MKCDRCNRQATVTCQYSVNGVGETLHLCPVCYEKWKQEKGGGWMNTLLQEHSAFSVYPSALQLFPRAGGRCRHCGQSYESYLSMGLLGCAHCYEEFRKELRTEVLPRMQQGLSYRGRSYAAPSPMAPGAKLKGVEVEAKVGTGNERETCVTQEEISGWKQELQEAVREERYEVAAKLRDRIHRAEALREGAAPEEIEADVTAENSECFASTGASGQSDPLHADTDQPDIPDTDTDKPDRDPEGREER